MFFTQAHSIVIDELWSVCPALSVDFTPLHIFVLNPFGLNALASESFFTDV